MDKRKRRLSFSRPSDAYTIHIYTHREESMRHRDRDVWSIMPWRLYLWTLLTHARAHAQKKREREFGLHQVQEIVSMDAPDVWSQLGLEIISMK